MAKISINFKDLEGLGKRLKSVRMQKYPNADILGHEIGIAGTTITRWEKGKGEPRLAYLVFLAGKMSVDLDWLILGREPVAPAKEDMPTNKEIALELHALREEIKDLRAGAAQTVPTASGSGTVTFTSEKAESTETGEE